MNTLYCLQGVFISKCDHL